MYYLIILLDTAAGFAVKACGEASSGTPAFAGLRN